MAIPICVSLMLLLLVRIDCASSAKEMFKNRADLNVALILHGCSNRTTPLLAQTLTNSAVWTTRRLNFLDFVPNFSVGLAVYETCTEADNYRTVFDIFQNTQDDLLLGIVTERKFSNKIAKFSDVLNIRTKTTIKDSNPLIKASIELLGALNFNENITILAPTDSFIKDFFIASTNNFICVKDYFIYQKNSIITLKESNGPVIIFGDNTQIKYLLKNADLGELISILVPLDGSVITGLPLNSYIIQPPHYGISQIQEDILNILPTPLLFEVAKPIIAYTQTARNFIGEFCNQTTYKLNCLRSEFRNEPSEILSNSEILDILKIEPLKPHFVYNIFKVTNNSYDKILSYNIFDGNLTVLDDSFELGNNSEIINGHCKNFDHIPNTGYMSDTCQILQIRTESWVFAFLSLSLLGVIFCIAILLFLLLSICRRGILEGNPVLTLLLLISVMFMYCSVLPLSLHGNQFNKESVCLGRALAITLSFASSFSLILSRCILLATAAKEIGFMSHISGPVQSFLCLFIFGVQAALSLQLIGRCQDIFRGHSFIYLLSYNSMLLLLLVCLSPLIIKCQRNYREGKYFTIAVCLISALWCVWIPSYIFLGDDWKDPILCFGLVSTASILIGTIFVPRTYLMTIAAEREKITSTLPSLATATSAMDIYRASTQPVYDCVNVAAINAVNVARAGVGQLQEPDLYTCPNLPDDVDFDHVGCDIPINTDKVTRF